MTGYIITGIGAAIMTFISNMDGDNGLMGWIIALVCAGIGIFMTGKEITDKQEKLKDLGFHLLAFIIGVVAVYLFALVMGLVVLAIFLQFMGVNVIGWALGLLDGVDTRAVAQAEEEPFTYEPEEEPAEPEKKVEVWRENGYMTENLKVSRDGERYYDPDAEEWRPINK